MKIINYIIFIVTIAGFITACKTTKNKQAAELKSMPQTYSVVKDSAISNVSEINWRAYFSDSNLVSLIDESLKSNLNLLATLQRIEIARADVKLTKGMLLPTVGASVIPAQRRYGLYTMDGAGNSTTDMTPGKRVPTDLPDYYLGFQAAWEVDVWGKLRNKKRAAMARYLGSVEGTNWMITNLIADVATTYYELLALDNQVEIIRETIRLQENALEIVQVQKEAGAANELAVEQFQAQLLNSKSFEAEVLQQLIETESKLNFLLGRYPQEIQRDKDGILKALPGQINAGIPSELLKNRPDIKQAEFGLTASKADVKAARAAFYPSLNITGSFGYQAFNTAYLFTSPQSLTYTLVGNLTAPLINRSAIKAGFNTAKANQLTAFYNYQESVIKAYVEVYNEMADLKNLQKVRDLKSQEVDVLNKSIETSTELFRTGRANYLEILMTQKNALQAKLTLVNTQKRQYNTLTNLYKALGGGWK